MQITAFYRGRTNHRLSRALIKEVNIIMEKKIDFLEVIEMCITSRCNLKCTHCYQHKEKNKYQLSLEQIVDIVNYTKKYNCRKYVLSGGEFFMHSNAYDILSYIVDNTNAFITCVSNLTIADVNRIASVVPSDRMQFKVSIDGDETEHDKRRGVGMFKIVEGKIKALREIGYVADITMTLVEDNIKCIPEVFSNPAFERITLMPVATSGAACDNFSKTQDSPEYKEVICHIYKTCRDYVDGSHRCYIFPRCFSIKYDGGVYPCSLSRDYDLCKLGNINDKSISEVLDDFISSDDSTMFFEYEHNSQIDKCNLCEKNKECTRGCRIRAYKWNGKLTSSDPFACKIFRGEYENYTFGDIYWGTKKRYDK